MDELADELEDLSSAEDFLGFFGIEYDAAVVHVNRLHILQRYHDYLEKTKHSMPEGEQAQRDIHRALLYRAYRDFIDSTALEERVFKVLRDAAGQGFVSLDSIETPTKA